MAKDRATKSNGSKKKKKKIKKNEEQPAEKDKKTTKKKLKKSKKSSLKLDAKSTSKKEKLKKKKKKAKKVKEKTGKNDETNDGLAASKKKKKKNKDKKNAKNKRKRDKTTGAGKPKKKKVKTEKQSQQTATSSKEKSSPSTSKPAWDEWRKSHEITITNPAIKPFFELSDAAQVIPANLMKICSNFTKPTPIQAQCWPALIEGHDLVGVAETGSGKTLSFLLPSVKHILDSISESGSRGKHYPRIMCLSPTRELAMQIQQVAEEIGNNCGLTSLCCYGGSPKWKQKKALQHPGVDIVIGTPGRTKDLLVNDQVLDLSRVSAMILDEADRMLDLGFEEDVRAIIGATPASRQTLMFSATWPKQVRELASKYFKNPVRVTVGSDDLTANVRVKQIVEVVEERAREGLLLKLLQKYHDRKNRVLIFGLYKKECARLEILLNRRGWPAQAIHGDKAQAARTAALAAFKDGSKPLLIATDVAARGLDIPNVEYVINFSFPLTIEDYIHRIGRTGRAGKRGVSHTFFHKGDKARSGELVNVLNEAKMDVPQALMNFGCTVKKKTHKMYGDHFRADVDMSVKGKRIVFD